MATKKTNPYGALGSQENLDKLLKALGYTSPSTGTTYNDPNFMGAGGRGDVILSDKDAKTLANASAGGASASEYGDVLRNPGGYASVPTLSTQQSAGLAKEYGLQGMADSDFVGLTQAQAKAKAQQIKEGKLSQVSPYTSFAFNPQSMAGTKNLLDTLQFRVDSLKNDPYETTKDKKDKVKALVDSYQEQFAKQFQSPEEFGQAYQTNQDFQALMKQYQKLGGDPNAIATKVAQPPVADAERTGLQSTADFLGEINQPYQQKALESLLPESQIAQERIAFEHNIVQQYKDYYFGTPEQIGLAEQQKRQAQEREKLIEKQAKLEEQNMRAQAQFAIDRNNAQMDKEQAQIEENRLAAKNYMTGMLAKLGALKTTGAAPQALVTLEQKYQKQSQQLRSQYDIENQGIELKLREAVNNLEIQKEENILKIREDLTISEDKMMQEIMKLNLAATRKTFDTLEKFAGQFRTQSEKYRKEAEKAAKDYAKQFSNTISAYDLASLEEGQFFAKGKTEGVLSPSGDIIPLDLSPTEQKIIQGADIRGTDAIRTFLSYPSGFRNWYLQQVQAGSLRRGASRSELSSIYENWLQQTKKTTERKTTTTVYDNAGNAVSIPVDEEEDDWGL